MSHPPDNVGADQERRNTHLDTTHIHHRLTGGQREAGQRGPQMEVDFSTERNHRAVPQPKHEWTHQNRGKRSRGWREIVELA